MRRHLTALLLGGALSGFSLHIAAAGTPYTGTYEGTVASGVDEYGLFGPEGADLTGLSFTETFTFNNNPAHVQTVGHQCADFEDPIDASLTINGQTYDPSTMSGNPSAGYPQEYLRYNGTQGGAAAPYEERDSVEDRPTTIEGSSSHSYSGPANVSFISDVTSASADGFPSQFGMSFDFTPSSTREFNGLFVVEVQSNGAQSEVIRLQQEAGDAVDPTSPVSAAPEPGAWALMMLGVAGLGAVLRRSRRENDTRTVVQA